MVQIYFFGKHQNVSDTPVCMLIGKFACTIKLFYSTFIKVQDGFQFILGQCFFDYSSVLVPEKMLLRDTFVVFSLEM